MEKGKRGRLILTVEGIKHSTLKQGLYEQDRFTYDLRADNGDRYSYFGSKAYAVLTIGRRVEVVATSDGFRYGATQLKRPRFSVAGNDTAELFERA